MTLNELENLYNTTTNRRLIKKIEDQMLIRRAKLEIALEKSIK